MDDDNRRWLEGQIARIVQTLHTNGQSLMISREAVINTFDEEASRCQA